MQFKFWNIVYIRKIRKRNMENSIILKHTGKYSLSSSLFHDFESAGFEQRQQQKLFYIPLSYLWLQTLTHH